MASTSEELSGQSEQLQNVISFFNVNSNGHRKTMGEQPEIRQTVEPASKATKRLTHPKNDLPQEAADQSGYAIDLGGSETETDLQDVEFERY